MKISLSIADLPSNISIQDQFLLAKKLHIDGIEILPGIKSRWPFSSFTNLSKLYNLPILSIHYPFWIGKFFISEKEVFEMANLHNALLVIHPLRKYPLTSNQQKIFLINIFSLSRKYKIISTLENLPAKSTIPIYRLFSHAHFSTIQLIEIQKICRKFSFGITLDTSHLVTPDIMAMKGFNSIYPLLKNVHLSDYSFQKQHLPLGEGNLDIKKLIYGLKNKGYKGIVTLELSPVIWKSKTIYFDGIKKSVEMIRRYST